LAQQFGLADVVDDVHLGLQLDGARDPGHRDQLPDVGTPLLPGDDQSSGRRLRAAGQCEQQHAAPAACGSGQRGDRAGGEGEIDVSVDPAALGPEAELLGADQLLGRFGRHGAHSVPGGSRTHHPASPISRRLPSASWICSAARTGRCIGGRPWLVRRRPRLGWPVGSGCGSVMGCWRVLATDPSLAFLSTVSGVSADTVAAAIDLVGDSVWQGVRPILVESPVDSFLSYPQIALAPPIGGLTRIDWKRAVAPREGRGVCLRFRFVHNGFSAGCCWVRGRWGAWVGCLSA